MCASYGDGILSDDAVIFAVVRQMMHVDPQFEETFQLRFDSENLHQIDDMRTVDHDFNIEEITSAS